jgi:hypothetical protein
MMPRMLRAGILTLTLTLLVAAPARAAEFDVTAFELTPSSTAAGAHADVTIATSFTPYDGAAPPPRPRNVVFHLPPGLAGDPFSTPRCSEADYRADACPPETRIGGVEVEATAIILLVPVAQTATGDLYNLAPAAAEPARLGAVIRPTGGLLGKLFVPTTIQARSTDGGLDSIVTDLPTELNGIQLYTERMAFTLQGRPAGGTGPFMRNPTSCRPAVTTVEATPYGDGPVKSRTSEFTPTDCGALAFQPHIAGSVGARGMTARQAKPPVTTVISQGAEQAGQSSATVTLPPVVAPDLATLGRACPPDAAAARACPASSKVGAVTAGTPLLAAPLTGDVFLVSRGPGALPGLTIQLADPIPLRLDGTVALTPQGLRTTFTGLPDVPLTRFQLDLFGGEAGVFQLSSDLCSARPAPTVAATFAAHSGKSFAETAPLAIEGCTPPPRASASITRLRSGKPTVRVRVAAGDESPELREVRVLLPDALRVKPKRARKGARATTNAGKLPRRAIKLGDGDLRLTLPAGARTVRATLSKGTIRAGRKLRRAKKARRLPVRLLVRDAHGSRPAIELKVRPRRR